MHDAPGGHASIVLGATTWLPVFLEAVADVVDRLDHESGVAV